MPYVSHLTHARRTPKEEYSRGDLVAANREPCYQLMARNDRPHTIKRHLHYAARTAVDNILLTDPDNGQVIRLRPKSDFNAESQYCSAINVWQIAVSGNGCGSMFPEHPVHLTSMSPPRSRRRAFLWRHPAQPARICHCAPPLPSSRTCK